MQRVVRSRFIDRSIFTKAERLRRLDEALELAVSQAITLDFTPDEISERLVVHDMELRIPRGSVTGLLGLNEAGSRAFRVGFE